VRSAAPVSRGDRPLAEPWVAMPLAPELEEGVFRTCTLQRYTKRTDIKRFEIAGEFVAYASPDSTYAVTRRLIDGARASILVGIYDFNAEYMRDLLTAAIGRGVKVSLMLDIDSPQEQVIFDALIAAGAKAVEAPSCASRHRHMFRSSHEKVIVIDGEWTLVQSGNYTKASIPKNLVDGGGNGFLTGNRDMGVAVRSRELAAFFTAVLDADIKLELDAEAAELPELPPARLSAFIMAEQASSPPLKLFPSLRLQPQQPVSLLPILTPDNYVPEVGRWLSSAKRSIWIENQYIKTDHAEIQKLLGKIGIARKRNPTLDVRVILAKGFDGGMAVAETFKALQKTHRLKVGKNLRILNPKRFDHLHNKLIIVDGTSVLISSQNWSNAAVTENREAGLLITSMQLAQYYASIFEADWADALQKAPTRRPRRRVEEAVLAGVHIGPADRGDYAEV
jgi:phosphatidylserine/phosphatidylglycerophosphate/cardiolipin synthase-like enzyme